MPDTQPPSSSRPVSPTAAYRLWSDRYEEETAVSALEDHAVGALALSVEGKALLDAGCGIGRRLAGADGTRVAVGVDLVPEMLAAGRARWPKLALAAGDLRALPFADGRFDLVWCRLAIGHIAEIDRAYAELGRVARTGGVAIVTDFHPDAVRAGHRRTFRDAEGRVHEVEHHVHEPADHERAATRAGWALVERRDAAIGPIVRDVFERSGRLDLYERQVGQALVLVLRLVRMPG